MSQLASVIEMESFVWFDRPGESSPEKDCWWGHRLSLRQPERMSSSESSKLCIVSLRSTVSLTRTVG